MTEDCGSVWHWFACDLPAGHAEGVCQQRLDGTLIAVWRKP